MTRILFYYPSNTRTVALETLILAIHRRGIPIELLTTCVEGPLHAFLAEEGVPVHAHPIPTGRTYLHSLVYYARQIAYLARFCRRRGFTTVFANLQHANFIAVFAQYLTKARVVAFRHHFKFYWPGEDIDLESSGMERFFDRVINRLAERIVVPSSGVYEGMRSKEKVDMEKVSVLSYVYDFRRYGRPDPDRVAAIRAAHPARLLLLMVARLIPFKRHDVVLPVVERVVGDGLDVRLIVLGSGPLREELEAWAREAGLDDRIAFLGFRDDVLECMAASDLLVHPSLTEASSNAAKEMGWAGRTVLACEGVGDFSDYLVHGENGFLVPRDTDGSEIEALIRKAYADPEELRRMGEALHRTVVERFSASSDVVDEYLALAGVGPQASSSS